MKWKTLQLGELLGASFSGVWGDAAGTAEVNVHVIKVSDISKNREVILEKLTPRSVSKKIAQKLFLAEGDIVVVKSSGSSTNIISGRAGYITADLATKNIIPSNFTLVLRPNTEKIAPKYLWYFLETKKSVEFVHSIVGGSTYPNIKVAQYLKMPVVIPVDNAGNPDIGIQRHIIDKLDAVFSGVDKGLSSLGENVNQTNVVKQAILQDIFSSSEFVSKKLSEVADINPKKDFSVLKPSDDVSFVPMESVDEVTGSIVRQYIKKLGQVSKGYTFFRNQDVIFAKITPCMENGKCAVAKDLTNGVGFGSTEFYVIRAKSDISPEYLWNFLRQENVRVEAKRHFTGAAGHKRVPKDFIENIEIPIPMSNGMPDIAVQEQIVNKLGSVTTLTAKANDLLTEQGGYFTTLRSSVLNQSFQMQT